MRLLLISDIHGNKEALDAILDAIKYDRIICMGDLVDYGPDPLAIIDWIRDNKIPAVMGNHDNAVALRVDCGCGYKYKHLSEATREYIWEHITENEENFLRMLPMSREFSIGDLKIRAVHGSPQSFFDYMYPDTPAAAMEEMLKEADCDILLAGHTHVPMIRKLSRPLVLNPGSVGQPRDGDWRASCMVFDTATEKPDIVKVKYDIDVTCDKIRKSMPHSDELITILKRGY